MFYPQLDVAELTGQRGLTIDYSNLIDHAAYAGDLNADGIEDRVVVSGRGKAIAFLSYSPNLTSVDIRII